MKYLMCAMQVVIIVIWIYMIAKFPNPGTPPFTSGIAFTLVWAYLMIQSCCVKSCGCKKG